MVKSEICCVSGYWSVKNKYGAGNYFDNFKLSLPLKTDFIFFTDNEEFTSITKSIRSELNNEFRHMGITDFLTYKYESAILGQRCLNKTHCPSSGLWMIWMEKMNLLKLAASNTDYEWYCWYDAGLSKFRKKRCNISTDSWPSEDKIKLLKCDKINVNMKPAKRPCGTAYILHKNMIDIFHSLFYHELESLLNVGVKNDQFTDQIILHKIYCKYPHLFNNMCCLPDAATGYGGIIITLS